MPDDARGAARAASSERIPALGIALTVLLTFIWGSSWPLMKICVETLQPWNFRMLTTLVAGAFMLAIVRASGTSVLVPRRRWLALATVSFFNITAWMLCSAFALQLLPAGRSAIIAYTMPAWAVLLGALFLRERITGPRALGLLMGLGGLGVLMGDDLAKLGDAPLGTTIMSLGAFSVALSTVLLKRIRWDLPVGTLSAWQLVLGGVPIAVGAVIADQGTIGAFGWREAGALAFVFFIGVMVGNWTWLKMISLMPASVASIGTIAIPVVGVGSSLLVLGEPIGWQEVAALALVVASLGAVLGRLPGRRRPPANGGGGAGR